MPRQQRRLAVQKTYKLFIGGKFARGENGRVIAARDAHGNVLANYCRASRKDFRDSVRAGRSAVVICAAKSCIAQPKCWKRAAASWKASLPALAARRPGRAAK